MGTVDFSSGYRDATKGATLKALQKRQDDQAAVTALAMKPREIGSMWQGAAQIGDVISGSIREGRLANQEAAGRARFAELLAGGLAPDEVGEAMGLDPETTQKWVERNWAQEDTIQKHGWDVDAATERHRQAMEQQKDSQTFTSGQTEDAQKHAFELKEAQDKAAIVLADHNASIEEKQAAQKVIDEAKVAALKVQTDKTAADEAAKRASEQSAQTAGQNSEIGRIKMGMRPGPNGEPPLIDEATGNALIEAAIKDANKKSVPPGLDELNRKTASEALDWKTTGASTAASNQANIDEAIKTLEQPGIMGEFGDNIGLGKTGAVAGVLPPSVASVLNPSGEKAAAAVQTAVQSSLKLILGSQFAMNEGEQLLKRSFDKSMPPSENVRRAKMIKAQLQQAAEAKEAFVKYYFDHNYNMDGYTGPNLQQIQADFDAKTNAGLDAMDAETGATPDAAAPDVSTMSDDDLRRIAGGTP